MPSIPPSTVSPAFAQLDNDERPHLCPSSLATVETLQRRCADAVARLEELQSELEKSELYHTGHRLMQFAGQAAVDAGQAEGPGLFEQYEAAKETEKVLHDAHALAFIWPLAKSPAELQRGIDMLDLHTLTGRLAATRLVKHYDAVLSHEFRHMAQPA